MDEKGIHAGHRQRLKQRFKRQGSLEGFQPHEALELLLFYAIPQGDTNPLAHRLMEEFGSLQAVLDASPEVLSRVKGVGEHTALLLTLIKPLSRLAQANPTPPLWVRNMAEAVAAAQQILDGAAEERVALLLMDSRGKLMRAPVVAIGTACSVEMPIGQIIEWVVRLRPASLILVHNHPEGKAEPSVQDDRSTRQLLLAMQFQDVQVSDHLILGRDEVYSYARENRLEQINRDVRIRAGRFSTPMLDPP